MRKRNIGDMVVVITGASSGIGRAVAVNIAKQGGTVVLAARDEESLREVAEQCRQAGGRTLTRVLDVRNVEEIKHLAGAAIETFGRIDVWINNAAVTLFGRLEECPPDLYKQVIETNVLGYAWGARAVIPYFREQGHGILINVSSVVGKVGQPLVSAYAVSKYAINGLSDCLRMELRDAPNIRVCTILPPSVDTPLFQHAGNYSGREIKPLEPVYDVERVAEAILSTIKRPRREVLIGMTARRLAAMRKIAPGLTERRFARMVEEDHFKEVPAHDDEGNIRRPDKLHNMRGGWRDQPQESGHTGMIAAAAVAIAGGALTWWMLRDRAPRMKQRDIRPAELREGQSVEAYAAH